MHIIVRASCLATLFLAACAPSTPIVHAPEATAFVISTLPVPPTQELLSFSPIAYRDEANDLELDYPDDWSLDPNTQIGSRGSEAQLLSPGTTAERLAQGGTRVSIIIYAWEPKGDLAAYVAHRRPAWETGGYTILAERTGQLVDGRQEASLIVQAPDGLQAFFLLTTLGDQYLQIAGEGDLLLIEEIARTARPLGFAP
jgi:hypothetical protein